MVVDELGDGAEIVLLSQVKVSLWSGADVVMSAVSSCFSGKSVERVSQQVFIAHEQLTWPWLVTMQLRVKNAGIKMILQGD